MIEKRLSISLFIFLGLGYFYHLAYNPVYFLDGIKHFNTQFTQGDVYTYLNFANREIAGQPFFSWFLKLNFNNISLVYFSWFQDLLYSVTSHEMILSVILLTGVFLVVREILRILKKQSYFSSIALVLSFSMLIYMQTYTKELLSLFFLFLVLLGFLRSSNKIIFLGMFALLILRIYFAFMFFTSIILYFIYKSKNRKRWLAMLAAFVVFVPYVFTKVFPHFAVPQAVQSQLDISGYYLFSIQYPGLFLLWLPFRIFQNIAESFLALYHTPIANIIFRVPVVLDSLTAAAIVLYFSLIWVLRERLKKASSFAIFVLIFVLVYVNTIASVPIVHFRYMVPVLPILGLLTDMLRPVAGSHELIGQK
jgi:hypothetical protein